MLLVLDCGGRHLIASRCLLALASTLSSREFRHRHFTGSTVLTKLPYAKRAEGIVITVRYPRYPWDTVTLLRYAKALELQYAERVCGQPASVYG